MFPFKDNQYIKIKELFKHNDKLLTQDFELRIKKSIGVLHFKYLWGSCKEAQILLSKHFINDLFALIMSIYNKKRKQHQAKFLLLHCFENALRSTLAVRFAQHYNQEQDNWFLNPQTTLISEIIRRRCQKINIQEANTFEIFDCFYLWDLQQILKEHWDLFSDIFCDKKEYKNQELPCYNKQHLYVKIDQIRNVRNDIFHNKPTKIKFQKDLEILLLRMEYNLKDAINIGDISKVINLQYKYS